MFGLQFSEIVIVLIVALILLGPKQLPQIARSVGRGLKEVRRAGQDLRETWEAEVEQTAGPELRALKNLRDPGALVDAAWGESEKSEKSEKGEKAADAGATGADEAPDEAGGEEKKAEEEA
ncbi:MAG: twin-arginine translocase TatA/TatE family subunit [Deltaproteobacteria bacterium]|nr:twin-arginine translocase TatA/TatE family subunit [Deltaproteobacteria bacterium]